MPKPKTHKGLAKRTKVTASGKVKVKKANGSHLMSAMSAKRRRNLGASAYMAESYAKSARKALCVE